MAVRAGVLGATFPAPNVRNLPKSGRLFCPSVERKIRQLNRWLKRGTGAIAHPSAKTLVFQFRPGGLVDTIKYAVPDSD